jgi:osmotically-inducible protein OsmY
VITLPFAATTPADRDLQQRVALFIQQRQLSKGARLTVLARRGVLTLAGVVPTFHHRQLLLSLARRVAGVVQVQDELDVETYDDQESEPNSPRRRDLALQES